MSISFAYDEHTRRWRLGFEGGNVEADAVVLAVPFESMQKLYPLLPPPAEGSSELLAEQLGHFQHSPITGIHLWFDRVITDLDHAVLLDTTIQWMYNKTRLQPQRRSEDAGSYLELVVSASKTLVPMSRQEIHRSCPARAGRILSGGARRQIVKICRGERSARDVFCYAGAGSVSAWIGHIVAGNLFGRGLDVNWLAFNDGRGSPQRESSCGGFDEGCREATEISASRLAIARMDALVSVEKLAV